MKVSPCKDCEDRTVTPNCHTNCIAYKRWVSEYRLEKKFTWERTHYIKWDKRNMWGH